jgi:DNA-binding transcriptional MocR family regulator
MKLRSSWRPWLAAGNKPVYERLVETLVDDIERGRVAEGARLPAQREVAHVLGIAVGTVTKAFTILERRGLVVSSHGSGTFVGTMPGKRTGMIDLSMNIPPTTISDRLLHATLGGLSRRIDAATFGTYQPPAGRADHRAALARWLSRDRLQVEPETLIMTNGAQHALAIAFAAAAGPGATIFTEQETYPGAITLARSAGHRLQGVAMDAEGLDPGSLDRALRSVRKRGPRPVVYVTPTLHNPTACTLSEGRRRAIVRLCRRHDAWLVEDDVYGALAEHQPTPLLSLAPERTFHVSGLSKVLSPGLRIGALVAPRSEMERVLMVLTASSTMASPLTAAVMEAWLVDGTASSIVETIRREAAARTALAVEMLDIPLPRIPGFHVWLPAPQAHAVAVQSAALEAGIALTPPSATVTDRHVAASGLRICLGGPHQDELRSALAHLQDLFRSGGRNAASRPARI